MSAALQLVSVRGLKRVFDVSRPWISRFIDREPRRLLRAVDGVDFTIERGQTFGIVGESGSGKSTLARMVVGLLRPSAGQVLIEGVDMAATSDPAARREVRRRMQMIFQDPYASLNPRWRIGDVIAEPLVAFGLGAAQASGSEKTLDKAGIVARVDDLLRLVGLDPSDKRRYPHEFSGGQRQRIAIARAIAANPDFIVCDEPTSALDVSIQAQILNLMRDLQETLGLTYLLITHNLAVLRHMATRVGVMYLGRLVEIAPTEELFAHPRHPYTRMLLDAVPDLAMSGRARTPVGGETPNPIDPPPGCPFHPRCPRAIDRCRIEAPILRDNVACHLPLSDSK
ncbi:ABC transporter ATP-binding protein [Methylocapsa sp. S129]|uniref:ABC transporter ATP-binding protein n=1 Tax=Methylocapsa sp. S129 TaxID=1641869 RepID=UPI00131B4230|nr:oligopeptide/dipeptide ABC transporter ATP-binding protein [Methylocapsa sp. S129]